jgi:LmbE family N-acetylglucosaminyl deacetylase
MAGRRVLAVFAHPDDETLACGGTLARLADAGARIVLVCVSRGERGTGPDRLLEPGPELGRLRTAELHAAARVLGIAEVLVHDHPDGSLRWADAQQIERELTEAMVAYVPEAVVTFDSDGLYWHQDHVGIHERTQAAVQSLGDAAPPLFFVAMRTGMMREVVDIATRSGWVAPTTGTWSITPDAFGFNVEAPSFAVNVESWVPRKLEALACYRSQFRSDSPFLRLGGADQRRLFGHEYFRRAPANVRASVFERYAELEAGSHA